jgi:outer membrane receptor protein involved in Fe transport
LGGKFNANFEAGRENFRTTLDSFGFDPAGATTDSFQLALNYRTRDREIGADWERAFGDVTVKLIALDRLRITADDDTTTERDAAGAFQSTTAQRVRNRGRESIARATVSFAPIETLTIEAGLEGAYNSLDAGLELSEDFGAGPRPIPLPAANVLIEEDRAEAFARTVWRFAPAWTAETSLAWETSTISQSGDTAASRTLDFWKPSVQIAHSFGEANQWRVRLFRDVGQLDFDDFASSADLNDQRVAAGNPDLAPQTEWRLEAGVDWRFGGAGAASVVAFHSRVSDVADSVPIATATDIFDAPGNIGDGEMEGVQLTATVPIDAVLPGGRIEIEGTLQRSRVRDPVTGRTRSFSGFSDSFYDVELRQDIVPWGVAWGFEYEGESEVERFRLSERETYVEGPFLSAFIETTATPVKLRLFASNLTDTSFRRERHFFSPTRADGPSFTELRKRTFGRFVGFELSGAF